MDKSSRVRESRLTPVGAPLGQESCPELFLVGWTMAGAKRHPGSECPRQSTPFVDNGNSERTLIESSEDIARTQAEYVWVCLSAMHQVL